MPEGWLGTPLEPAGSLSPTRAGWQGRASMLSAHTGWDPKYPRLGHRTHDAGAPGKFRVQSITYITMLSFVNLLTPTAPMRLRKTLGAGGAGLVVLLLPIGMDPPRPRGQGSLSPAPGSAHVCAPAMRAQVAGKQDEDTEYSGRGEHG